MCTDTMISSSVGFAATFPAGEGSGYPGALPTDGKKVPVLHPLFSLTKQAQRKKLGKKERPLPWALPTPATFFAKKRSIKKQIRGTHDLFPNFFSGGSRGLLPFRPALPLPPWVVVRTR